MAFDDDFHSGEDLAEDDAGDESFHTANGSFHSYGEPMRNAVAFALGIDTRSADQQGGAEDHAADWTPLTIYTLCSNGDVFGLSPFLPAEA